MSDRYHFSPDYELWVDLQKPSDVVDPDGDQMYEEVDVGEVMNEQAARIATLDADLTEARAENAETYSTWLTTVEQRAEQAEGERDELRRLLTKAEAALAEQDRMLRLVWKQAPYREAPRGSLYPVSYDDWLADLRARAEEGSEP